MKTKLQFVIRHSSFVIALALCAVAQIASGVTAFSYQGRLMNAAGTACLPKAYFGSYMLPTIL